MDFRIIVIIVTLVGNASLEFQTTLDADAQKFAAETLEETATKRDETLEELTAWITTNKDQFTAPTDPLWLLTFLRIHKFNIEETKTHILEFLKFRASAPEWFTNRDPEQGALNSLLKKPMVVPLRGRDKHGRSVILMRLAAYNPSKYDLNDVLKVACVVMDVLLSEREDASVYGIVLVADLENYGLQHVAQLTPSILQKAGSLWTVYNYRAESLEYFNVPGIVNVALSIFKSFLPAKYRNRIHVHAQGVQVSHIIPKSILPVEYFGEDGTLKDMTDEWAEKCKQKRDWLIETEAYKTNT